MTMSLKMILIMYAVKCICACDITKLTISHIYINCDNPSVVDLGLFFIMAIFCSGLTNNIIFNKIKKTAIILDSCVKYWLSY